MLIDQYTTIADAAVGDKVMDYPSNAIRSITAIVLTDCRVYFEVDAPSDPTGDRAFTNGWRTPSEIGPVDQPRPLDWTY